MAYHESFYRYVEATSLTPFSGPALDRGLTGTLVSMVRHGDPAMTAPTSAMEIAAHRAHADACVEVIAARGGGLHSDQEDYARTKDALTDRGTKLLDAWTKIATIARDDAAAKRSYSKFDREKTAGKPLLFTVIDDNALIPTRTRVGSPRPRRCVTSSPPSTCG